LDLGSVTNCCSTLSDTKILSPVVREFVPKTETVFRDNYVFEFVVGKTIRSRVTIESFEVLQDSPHHRHWLS